METKKLSLLEHLTELRRRLIISLVALFLGMLFSFTFLQDLLFNLVNNPLRKLGLELVALSVTEGFLLQLKIAVLGGLLISSPIILWQIIAFVLPALYENERKIGGFLFVSGLCLFVLGIIFAYQVVLELGLRFLLIEFGAGLIPFLSASKYLSFLLGFLVPFGLVFEIPLVVYLLTKAGILTPQILRKKRRYVILLIFILAAFLTPPDVFSQILLALPMLVLYEVSILLAVLVKKRT